MRVHIQNNPNDALFAITPAQWHDAMARAAEGGHVATFADDATAGRAALADAEALVSATGSVRRLFPCDAPKLRVILCTSAGLDRLAPFDWVPDGVALLNNRGVHGAKASEYVLMALLMLATRMPAMIAAQRAGVWEKHYAAGLSGRNVTVIGLGAIGGSAASLAARMGMVVTGVRASPAAHPDCARVVTAAELDAVLPETEFLVIACPLTEATRGLIDRRRLGLLPTGAGVVNVGRGAVMDQDALCDTLDSGALSGAVLDVFVPEPIPPGHRLWTTRNLVITPHVSADDPTTYNPLSLDLFFENLRAMGEGRAFPNLFDVARGY